MVNSVGKVRCGGILLRLICMLINMLIICVIIVFGLRKGESSGKEQMSVSMIRFSGWFVSGVRLWVIQLLRLEVIMMLMSVEMNVINGRMVFNIVLMVL